MENVNTRQRFYFSFSELRYSLLQFQSRRIRQNMTNRTDWDKKEEVCNSTNSLFAAVTVVATEAPYCPVSNPERVDTSPFI